MGGCKILLWDLPFKTSACLRERGVSPCADGQKVTVHKDQKSPSQAFCWNADGRGVGVKNRKKIADVLNGWSPSPSDGTKSSSSLVPRGPELFFTPQFLEEYILFLSVTSLIFPRIAEFMGG